VIYWLSKAQETYCIRDYQSFLDSSLDAPSGENSDLKAKLRSFITEFKNTPKVNNGFETACQIS
jgi:hypothetical protein